MRHETETNLHGVEFRREDVLHLVHSAIAALANLLGYTVVVHQMVAFRDASALSFHLFRAVPCHVVRIQNLQKGTAFKLFNVLISRGPSPHTPHRATSTHHRAVARTIRPTKRYAALHIL